MQSAASADFIMLQGPAPVRASTANAGNRGNLPTMESSQRRSGSKGSRPSLGKDKSPLQEHLGHQNSWGPVGGPGRWGPGFPAIWETGRDLKSADAAKRPSSGVTQIVMFPTPTHAVRPVYKSVFQGKLARSHPTLPQVDEPGSSLLSSASAPVLTEKLLAESGRAQTADWSLSLRKRYERRANAVPAVGSKSRRLAHVSPVRYRDGMSEHDSDDDHGDYYLSEQDAPMIRQSSLPQALVTFMSDDRFQVGSGPQLDDNPQHQSRACRKTLHSLASASSLHDPGDDSLRAHSQCGDYNSQGDEARPASSPGVSMASPRSLQAVRKDPRAEDCRQRFREEFLRAAGCAPEVAFRSIDLNGNGQLSLQEFSDGMSRLNVKWQEVTNLTNLKDVFKLFMHNGVVRLHDVFPGTKRLMTPPNRMNTPEFWNHWCRSTPAEEPKKRGPRWLAADADEEILNLCQATQARQNITDRKRWMAQTIRRMKTQGKSDARCRELCASHLPRGTGPRDKELVPTFSQVDVKTCRRNYADAVTVPLRNIQKQVYAMREQRLELHSSREELRRMNQRNARIRKQKVMDWRLTHGGLDMLPDDMCDSGEEDDEDHHDKDAVAVKDSMRAVFGSGPRCRTDTML